MSDSRPTWFALLGILISLICFYPELFLAKSASLMGDHGEQHYPWAWLLADHIKQFKLPFWTPLTLAGYPLAAESQIGIFYLPNLILSFLLPIRWAYAYTNVIHFLIAGWGTFAYARAVGLRPPAALVAALTFLYGASYGGAFYNITSLKTVCWFPVVLALFENYLATQQKRQLAGVSLAVGMSLVAGYLQVAVLTWIFFTLYALVRIFFFLPHARPKEKLTAAFALAPAMFAAAVIALPQVALTYELSLFSQRVDATEEFAFLGSLSPLAVSTLINPVIQGFLRGTCLYVGLFSFFLALIPLSSRAGRTEPECRLWLWMTLLAFLLALGGWSPLYVAIVKITQFYAFRTPGKFLVFICFGISILAGFGFQTAWESVADGGRTLARRIVKVYGALTGVLVLGLGALYAGIHHGRESLHQFGAWYLKKFVYGHAGHPHSLEVYLKKLDLHLDGLKNLYSLDLGMNVWTLAVVLTGLVFAGLLYKKGRFTKAWLIGGILFLCVDLYGYSRIDMQMDFGSYADQAAPNRVIRELIKERERGRLARVFGYRAQDESLAMIPSLNMIYGIEDIGGYSPLVTKRYHESIGQLGNVNDSTLQYSPDPDFVLDRLALLSALDVSHLLAARPLNHESLELVMNDPKTETILYRNQAPHSRAHFTSRVRYLENWEALKAQLLRPGFDPRRELLLEGAGAGKSPEPAAKNTVEAIGENRFRVTAAAPGYLIWMTSWYPGWQVTVNDQPQPLLKAYGLFQAVEIREPGTRTVAFRYRPTWALKRNP